MHSTYRPPSSLNYMPSTPPLHLRPSPSVRLYSRLLKYLSSSASSAPATDSPTCPSAYSQRSPEPTPSTSVSIMLFLNHRIFQEFGWRISAQFLRTSAASAAFLRASSCADALWGLVVGLDPSVRGGPPTFLGRAEVLFPVDAGADESVRPGVANGSDDSLPQQFPMTT
jgi:hypothetical protein